MSSDQDELILRGVPISRGIGIGSPVFFIGTEERVSEITIGKKEIEGEIDRYRRALALSRQDVEVLQQISLNDGPPEIASILGTHLEMMQDPVLTHEIEERIRGSQKNTESIVRALIQEYENRFSHLQDHYFKERVRDIVDVSRRILGHLLPLGEKKMGDMPLNSVILTHELVPSETVEANSSLVSAFVTAAGGITSHAAIIARAKGIPYVTNVDIKELKKVVVRSLIVDGSQGIVIINPNTTTLQKYQEIQKSHQHSYTKLQNASQLKGETVDGYEVDIFANLENPKEIEGLIESGANGVGLFRSEYLFLSRKSFPTEEEQFAIFKKMAESLKDKPLVVRIFDVGGDKTADTSIHGDDAKYFKELQNEPNPAFGCRAIRFLLRFPEILRNQLRAIIRASHFGTIHILIPMVSDVSEIRKVKEEIQLIKDELRSKNIPFAEEIPIGCMIEVPSSVIMCDVIADEIDFLSIGTNDLVQYVLAADRCNSNTSEIYHTVHPSILRLIRMVVVSAQKARKPVILCGECAADPSMIPLLIGLGIREFSVSSRHIPLVKHTIRKWRIIEACRLAEGALEHATSEDLKGYLAVEAVR